LEDGQFEFTAADGHEVNIDLDETEKKVDINLNLDEENWCIAKEYDLENREEAVMEFGGKPLFDPNFIQGIEIANNYFEVNQLIVNARKELEDETLKKSDSDPDNQFMKGLMLNPILLLILTDMMLRNQMKKKQRKIFLVGMK
jgi:hypothetical protein